jgi:CHASE2 domain-containing sensor protein
MTASRASERERGAPVGGGRRDVTPRPPPYRGLERFTESDDDAALFFGRASELEVVAANLFASRLTVLYGRSGVGKSSFLRAGLFHRIGGMTASEPSDLGAPGTVVVLLDEWLADPAAELWRLVVRALPTSDGDFREELGDRSLHDALDALSRELNVEFLIVLDQFEQYLAAHPRDSGDRFGDELPRLVADRDLPLRLLLALRDDALAGLDRFKGRIPELFDNYLRLDGLGPTAAREAIEGPIERWNSGAAVPVRLEDGLVDEVLRQLAVLHVAPASAAPPPDDARIEPAHLQLVMARLWAAETAANSRLLRLTTLESLGGAATIVRTHVRGAMRSLPARDQRLAAQVLRYLITPSGAKVRHVASDLAEYVDRPEPEVRGLLERLSSGALRILRPAPPPPGSSAPAAYEVFHDVLTGALLDWRSRFERDRLEARARRLSRALVAVSALAIALAVYLWNPGLLRGLELDTVDMRFAVRGETAASRDIVLVAIDDATLRAFTDEDGLFPRAVVGRLLDSVNAGRPRAIAVDILFVGARSPAGDRALIAAMRRARSRLVLASFDFVLDGGRVQPGPLFGRDDFLKRSRITAALPAVAWDPGEVVRRIDYEMTVGLTGPEVAEDAIFPTLAAKAAEVAGVDPDRLPDGARRRALEGQAESTTWIDYHGGPGTFRAVSARDVLWDRAPSDAFRDKVVVIGLVESGTVDVHRTSVDPSMPGPEVHANAISTILRGAPLRDAPRIVDVLLIAALGLVPLLAWTLRSWSARIAVVVGAALVFLVGVQLLFAEGKIVALVAPLFALALATLGLLLVEALQLWTRRRGARPAA